MPSYLHQLRKGTEVSYVILLTYIEKINRSVICHFTYIHRENEQKCDLSFYIHKSGRGT